jgi:tetratricopeptide (TPR) repeat protein
LTESKLASGEYKEAIRILEKEIRNNIKAENEQLGSLVALRASLSNLTRQYDEMSEAERESASGQDLAIHINAITDKLKGAEEATQRFYRNVGRYEEAFSKALSPLKQKLDDMTEAYMKMSKEERLSAQGEEMRERKKTSNRLSIRSLKTT